MKAGSRSGVRRLFRLPLSTATLDRDIEEELAFHVECRITELEARGATRAVAEEQAMREFGDLEQARRELGEAGRRRLRHSRRMDTWDALRQDVRYALRGVRRQPGFALTVVLTLGLAMAANATMFGITDRLLLRAPAHVTDPENVVRIGFEWRSGSTHELITRTVVPWPDYAALRENVAGFAEVGAISFGQDAAIGLGEESERIRLVPASASFFRVLGVRPALGRFFLEEEDAPPHGLPVAVISHGLWQRRFGGDAGVLGSRISVNFTEYTVVGVAPPGFHDIDLEARDAWIPLSLQGARMSDTWYADRNMTWLRVVARLAPDTGPEVAAAQATVAHAVVDPQRYANDADARVVLGSIIAARGAAFSLSPEQRRAVRISVWLSGVALVVLLIACANVANLLLARTLNRRREVGIRLAMGVGRGRLAAQLFTEVLLLALLGAVVGLVLAGWGGQFIRGALMPGVEWQDGIFSARLLLFSLAIVTAAALLAAIAPAFTAARMDVSDMMRSGARAGQRRSTLRSGLVVAQAALCVMLLVGAGLFVRSLGNAHAVELGYDAHRLVMASWPSGGVPGAEQILLHETAAERLAAMPYVEGAALLNGTTPFYIRESAGIRVPGIDSLPSVQYGWLRTAAGPDYFRTMGTPIVRGRAFTDADRQGAPPVVIVSERMADLLWPRGDALGKCFHVSPADDAPCAEVVGIAGNTRVVEIEGDPGAAFYIPLAQQQNPFRILIIRTAGDPARAMAALRRELQAHASHLPAPSLLSVQDRLEPQLRPWRLGATLFTIFGGLALVLAALGLYAVIAYDVAQRGQEIGVRLALGARAGDIGGLIFRDAARVAILGVTLGLGIALLLVSRVETLLLGVAPRDPATFITVGATLLAVSAIAAAVPALRAQRIDPVRAMKAE
jgi:putative ABC transport system permease protein